jgi:ATP-dependent DNA helicase RecQ
MTPSEVLKKYWGYDSFRPKQEDIVRAALEGKDVLAILPTGGGKSVCFQVPALMREGIAIVVTPLIALMKDQIQNLNDRGIKALCVNAGMGRREVDLTLNNAAYGDFKFLYVSPERLGTPLFKSYLQEMNVSFIVVDEAHCISQWGYDFRPDYLQIGKIREMVDAPLIALTATATPQVAEDIMNRLGFDEKCLIKSGFERPNLSYIVRRCEDKLGQMLNICNSVAGTGIVYVRSRKKTEELAAFLSANGISASFYHAGLGPDSRSDRQARWKSGEIRVMVCTNAFGMGIDKPDVRFVIHFDVPDSPEAYFQEAGRGGRDGKRSFAVTIWNASDTKRLHQIATVSFPSLEYIEDIYHKVHIFFDIPYDTGAGRQLKFDLDEFCRRFKLQRQAAYYSIVYIERTGHWTMSEDVDISTKVQITVSRSELYDVEFPDVKMVQLLEVLMRRYTGVYSFAVPIDEEYVAGLLDVQVPMLRQLLYKLSLEHVIKYIPCDHATVLFLHHERLRPKNVNLDPERYDLLKSSALERMQKMIDYISEEDTCRSSFLLEYFGQTESQDCGTCDICRNARKTPVETKATESEDTAACMTEFVNNELSGRYTLSDIATRFGRPGSASALTWKEILRRLIDLGNVPPPQD